MWPAPLRAFPSLIATRRMNRRAREGKALRGAGQTLD
jgi:hypothetical protein